jgi:hypothetical protein
MLTTFLRVVFTIAPIALIGLFVIYNIKKNAHRNQRVMDAFLESEREANNARRRDIDNELFYEADLSALPLKNDGSKQEEKVKTRAALKMIRFPRRMTNLELKMAYGPSQLDLIALYEENFNRYISALIELAEHLLTGGQDKDALRILEHTVELGSEYRKSYTLTANCYAEARDEEKLAALLETVEGREFTDESIKRHILLNIMDAREKMNQ